MLKCYKELSPWGADDLPAVFQKKHNTKEGTWGQITVSRGSLSFTEMNEAGDEIATHVFSEGEVSPFVEPQSWHKVAPMSDDMVCQLKFFCKPERYFEKKYNLTTPHSEVQALLPLLKKTEGRSVLDLGSGRGRNSFFLNEHGFTPISVDKSEQSIATLKKTQAGEDIDFSARVYDINSAKLGETFDHMVSTVVFQFLDAAQVPAIIANAQNSTRSGGYHLIVAPMDTEAMPCPIHFSFRFKEGELRNYYEGWEIVKYEETAGEFHRKDENGDRFKSMFVTLVARKV